MTGQGFILMLLIISVLKNVVMWIWLCRSRRKKVHFGPTIQTVPRRGPDTGFEQFRDAWSTANPPSVASMTSSYIQGPRTRTSSLMTSVSRKEAAAALSSGSARTHVPAGEASTNPFVSRAAYEGTGARPRESGFESIPLNPMQNASALAPVVNRTLSRSSLA